MYEFIILFRNWSIILGCYDNSSNSILYAGKETTLRGSQVRQETRDKRQEQREKRQWQETRDKSKFALSNIVTAHKGCHYNETNQGNTKFLVRVTLG